MSKILVIEDSVEVRENLILLLKVNDYEVISADDGVQGYEMIFSDDPDLIIADIMMPRMNGVDMLKSVKEKNPGFTTPFIFLTAKSSTSDIRQGMNLGADDYITKPFKSGDILSAVKSRLQKKEIYDTKFKELYSNIAKYIPHELRTPLVSIIGFTNIINNYYETMNATEIKEMMNNIKFSSNQLHSTIEKFLLFSDSEFIQKHPEKNKGLLTKTSSITQSRVQGIFDKKLISANQDIWLNLFAHECDVLISEEHLDIILGELIENAIKFSDDNKSVEINSSENNEYFTITIKNTGRTMTDEEIQNISPFIQFNRDVFEQSGNGLGLMIVKRLTEFYGTELNISSLSDKGTEVSVGFKKAGNIVQSSIM